VKNIKDALRSLKSGSKDNHQSWRQVKACIIKKIAHYISHPAAGDYLVVVW